MNLFGIPLRRPRYVELTSSAILAVGLWLLALGLLRAAGQSLTAIDAASALIVIAWSCLAVPMGISIARGGRHLVANLAGSAVLLGLLHAWAA